MSIELSPEAERIVRKFASESYEKFAAQCDGEVGGRPDPIIISHATLREFWIGAVVFGFKSNNVLKNMITPPISEQEGRREAFIQRAKQSNPIREFETDI